MQTGIVDAPNIGVDYPNDIGHSPDVAVDCRSVASDRSNATVALTNATVDSADVALDAANLEINRAPGMGARFRARVGRT